MIDGIIAGESVSLFKKIAGELLAPEFEEDNIINLANAAFEASREKYYKKYGDQFGPAGNTFLEREKNIEFLVRSVFPGCKDASVDELESEGFHGSPQASTEAKNDFLKMFREQLETVPVLAEKLTTKEIFRKIEDMHNKIGEMHQGSKDGQSTGPGFNLTKYLTPLPARMVTLLGREKELKDLSRLLQQKRPLVLVNGLGGVGKTECCKQFFYDQAEAGDFQYLAWVDYIGNLDESLSLAFSDLLKNRVSPELPMEEKVQYIWSLLHKLGPSCLLVIDNIDDETDTKLMDIFRCPCRVLATSRLHLEGFETYDLDILPPQECRELFYRFYKGEHDDAILDEILKIAGYHTLTVELLARTAQNGMLSLSSLQELLKQEGFNLGKAIPEDVSILWHRENPVQNLPGREGLTVNDTERTNQRLLFFEHILKVFRLSGVEEEEEDILRHLSLLPALSLDIPTICRWLDLPDKKAINSLVRKGWLKQEGFSIYLHPVIGEALFEQTAPCAANCARLVTALADDLSCEPGENRLEKSHLLPFAEPVVSTFYKEYVTTFAVQEEPVGDSEQNKLDDATTTKQYQELARLSNALSIIHQDLGQLERALANQEKAIAIREKVLSPDHPALATSYNNVSQIYQAMGDLERALANQEKATTIYEKVLSPDHPSLAQSYNNVASIYKALGRLPEALDYSRRAVAILEKLFPNGHYNLDIMRNNLESIEKDMRKN